MENSRRVRLLTIRNWLFFISAATVSIFVGWRYGHLLEQAEDTLSGILSVFSILAGVLVAVISIIGDPSMLLSGSWRTGYTHAEQIQLRLARFSHLVFIYVLTLVLVLVATVLKENKIEGVTVVYQILMGFTVLAVILSLPLPYILMGIQKDRMTAEVSRRQNGTPSAE
ncbi:hypothetical protein F9L00_12700 [Brucella anthropi]|uniref:hypothetical protein n=1 Tax=Brucella/Ochrobactrum group TaxID=2826938 RepID=UPI00124E05E7|nr:MULTISPECIES: hypothetical protein [Brucella/Ochrobactrum group]KAB2761729.1 hypothetical protein F9K98_15535 [Brucella anthropi]KAB2777581.1 hypothetical protein F9L00_12700 [Brucella anthropi]MCQ9145123.1 hypothetical protein [Ochrobactrum sp. BTU2]UGQ23249.1 hypothetical protein LRL11_22415 [Brucella anthropi]